MSKLQERPLDNLADIILNIRWQDLLEIWSIIYARIESEGEGAVKQAFEAAVERLLTSSFSDHIEVRWGMSQCPHCNDDNIEKNGIAYTAPNGDGLEFNQCLNCRIGILYKVEGAQATLESYNIGLGLPKQFNGHSFYWNAIVPEDVKTFIPSYELIKEGQWIGSIFFDEEMKSRFLSFESMTHETPRSSEQPWSYDLPEDVAKAVDEFLRIARHQVEVALLL